MAMPEGGGHEGFLWENQSWAFSNSDNSGGTEEKSGKKLPESSMPPNGQEAREKEVAPVTAKKRSGGSKNGKGKADQGNEEKGGGGGESDHEIHIWTERERRKKMRNMFSNLHALLPQLPPKADKSTIVDEAVSYIRTLQHTLQKLQKQKLERLHGLTTMNFNTPMITPPKIAMETTREAFLADQGGSSSNSTITAANSGTSLSVPGFPINFQSWISPNVTLNVCGYDAHISVCSPKKPGLLSAICFVLEKHKLEVVSAQISSDRHRSMYMIQAHANSAHDQFPGEFPVEEIYKQAAGEILFWVSS